MKKTWPAATAGGMTAALGLLVMGGWHVHRIDLVRVRPSLAPMQYDAAASFLLCGAGLAALAFGRRRPAAALGAAVAVVASWSMLRTVTGLEFGLERLLSDAATRDAIPASLRMEPLSALAFLLAGAALLGRTTSSRRMSASATFLTGALLAGFGAIVSLCYLGGIASAFGWENLTRVPPQSGLGFAVVGLGLLAQAWPRRDPDAADSRWLPVAAGVGVATAALFLWTALKVEERVRIQWHVDAAASALAERLVSHHGTGRRGNALRPEQLFGQVLHERTPPAYAFAVYLGRRPLYVSPGAPEPRPDEYARDVEVRLGGEAGWVRVWPSAELLRVEHSRLPASVGAVGILLALLLAWSVHLAQLARRQAREIAAASAAKSRFLANISREFGNPLNSIIGFSEILLRRQEGTLNPEQEEDLRAILGGGQRLAFLMRELLELARVEAGKVTITLKPVAGGEVVEDVRREFAQEAERKGLSLRIELDARAGLVIADPQRLRQALAFLVANAIKFTRHGAVTLTLQGNVAEVLFSVRDTGAGLSPEEKDKLFEPFWQSRRLEEIKKAEGLGLSLYLAKRLVELQGGRLTAEAAAEGGTAFIVRLPLSRPRGTLKEER